LEHDGQGAGGVSGPLRHACPEVFQPLGVDPRVVLLERRDPHRHDGRSGELREGGGHAFYPGVLADEGDVGVTGKPGGGDQEGMPVVIALREQVADALLEHGLGPRVCYSVTAHPSVATSRPRVRIHARASDAGSRSTLVLLRWTYSLVRAESFDSQSAEPSSPPTGMWPIAVAPSAPMPRRRS